MSTDRTSIEWTDSTWNPTKGCSRVSEGCRHCYAETIAGRFSYPGQAFHGFALAGKPGSLWTGKVALTPSALDQPFHWKKPRKVFVNSMSDLFHEGLSDEQIASVFAVMIRAKHHTFQVLTKRAKRMRDTFAGFRGRGFWMMVANMIDDAEGAGAHNAYNRGRIPPQNVWLGVSVEDQQTADERITYLCDTPAAKRFVSYEPALGPVDFERWLYVPTICRSCGSSRSHYDTNPKDLPVVGTCLLGAPLTGEPGATRCTACQSLEVDDLPPLDWIIVGGESGQKARVFELAWARATRVQCMNANTACFVKQLGSNAWEQDGSRYRTKSSKGGDMAEWPEDLKVREFPGSVSPAPLMEVLSDEQGHKRIVPTRS